MHTILITGRSNTIHHMLPVRLTTATRHDRPMPTGIPPANNLRGPIRPKVTRIQRPPRHHIRRRRQVTKHTHRFKYSHPYIQRRARSITCTVTSSRHVVLNFLQDKHHTVTIRPSTHRAISQLFLTPRMPTVRRQQLNIKQQPSTIPIHQTRLCQRTPIQRATSTRITRTQTQPRLHRATT